MTLKMTPTSEGKIHFKVESARRECFTWYKIFGELKKGVRPLIVLHGGPGIGHNYLLSLQDLARCFGVPVIFYDQIGCGNSTHLKEKDGDEAFWTAGLFIEELNNLIDHLGLTSYDVLGHSWGGMFAAEFGITQPKGLHKLIIASAAADMHDWARALVILRAKLPKDVRETLDRCEREGNFQTPEFENACMYFYHQYVCRLDPWPQELVDSFSNVEADSTVYVTMFGENEISMTGNLKDWSVKGKLDRIKNDVLLLNGRYDEAIDMVMKPYWKELGGQTKWYTFAEASHMPFWEERDHFMELVAEFLKD